MSTATVLLRRPDGHAYTTNLDMRVEAFRAACAAKNVTVTENDDDDSAAAVVCFSLVQMRSIAEGLAKDKPDRKVYIITSASPDLGDGGAPANVEIWHVPNDPAKVARLNQRMKTLATGL